jgi:flagellar biogenesis protein FliO
MQKILVILTFSLAAFFLLKKFVWNPIFDGNQKKSSSIDGENTKCGKNDCACH